jgi:hypothetical protein
MAMAARRSDKRAGEGNRLREHTEPAAAYVRVFNVAHKPETEITEADVEKLLAWIDRRWGKPERRDPNEANRWWDYLSSFRRESLSFVCEKVKDGPRPTLAQVRALCLQYVPKQRELV